MNRHVSGEHGRFPGPECAEDRGCDARLVWIVHHRNEHLHVYSNRSSNPGARRSCAISGIIDNAAHFCLAQSRLSIDRSGRGSLVVGWRTSPCSPPKVSTGYRRAASSLKHRNRMKIFGQKIRKLLGASLAVKCGCHLSMERDFSGRQ